jgi:hypothetical protein
VSPDGDVQNRVVFTEQDYTQTQLVEAANFLNANYSGMAIEHDWRLFGILAAANKPFRQLLPCAEKHFGF